MEFRLLGPFAAGDGRLALKLPGRKARALLLLLLLNRNTVVSADRIIDQLWAGTPPSSAPNLVQVYIWQLRRAFAELNQDKRIETMRPGYRLHVEPGEVDLDVFEQLVGQARNARSLDQPDLAASLLSEAVGMWHGAALADVTYDEFAQAEVTRLEELRLEALEDLFDAQLATGFHKSLISELQALVAVNPLRERLRSQLMLALARSDRLADALRAAREGRRIIQAELGVEPGAAFQDLEEALLTDASWIRPPSDPIVSHSVISRGSPIITFLAVDEVGERTSGILEAIRGEGGRFLDRVDSACLAVMPHPRGALDVAQQIENLLRGVAGPKPRLAVHAGTVTSVGQGYVGTGLDRCVALLGAARPGQLLVSGTLRELAPKTPIALTALGFHRLSDLAGPEQIFILDLAETQQSDLCSLDGVPNNLPDHPTSFVGRRHELDSLVGSILSTKLTTLCGPPGIGKTRLAVQAAGRVAVHVPDGVWVVDLTSVEEGDSVERAVLRVLKVSDQLARDPLDVLLDFLSTRTCLLVLDNCEHVVGPTARMVQTLLDKCDELRVLATSRTPLALDIEVVEHLQPLGLPESNDGSLYQSPAVQLFAERAALATPGFSLTESTVFDVANICRALDGVPLALELAATRLSTFGLSELGNHLADQLWLHSDTNGNERHRNVGDAVDWGYEVLTDSERMVLRRLAFFGGSFTAESAHAVAATTSLNQAAEIFQTLRSHSLLTASTTSPDRYRVLEPIRQYALHKLIESGDIDETRRRYIEWCVAQADAAFLGLRDHRLREWLRHLDLESDNLRIGLRLASDHDPSSLPVMAGGLWFYWYLRGQLSEGRSWLEAAADIPTESDARCKVLNGLAIIALNQGDNSRARAAANESYRLGCKTGDHARAAVARNAEGLVDRYEAAYDRSAAAHREALELSLKANASLEAGMSSTFLGLVEYYRGNQSEALTLMTDALGTFRSIGWPWGRCLCLTFLGLSQLAASHIDQASTYLQDGLAAARDVGHPSLTAQCLEGLAAVAGIHGHMSRQARLLEQALRQHELMGEVWRIAECLDQVAQAAALNSAPLEAASLSGAAGQLRRRADTPRTDAEQDAHDRLISVLRRELDPDTLEAALAEGAARTMAQSLTAAIHLTASLGHSE